MDHEERREKYGPMEEYAGGDIKSNHGIVNKWLLLVYTLLFLWSLYYLLGPFEGYEPQFGFWGGLGPGLALENSEGLTTVGTIGLGVTIAAITLFYLWVLVLAIRK